MTELSGNTKQLCTYINSVFPGGALFLIASDTEVKRFFMELTTAVLRSADHRKVSAARTIGLNSTPDGFSVWVFSPSVMVSALGTQLTTENSPIVWLERPHSTSSNLLISESLACDIATPLDQGEAFQTCCMQSSLSCRRISSPH